MDYRLRSRLLCWRSGSHAQILYIVSRVPSEVVLSLGGGGTTGTIQTGTHSVGILVKVEHPPFFRLSTQTHEG